ncbi:NAD(P)H-hydrate dehydratase [Sphingobacterium sp. HMA12]|uniref:NAD(P)H-hydrate dehydratase n=1 Tax=Sphingobacterium sp. HMA12 TaxID=2050894 RepID=UPI000CEA69EB|nr:NAD(P)H-hydrate dehydratase [Sphingobacterium sp. HMA12]
MKILSAAQMSWVDQQTMKDQEVSSLGLMERAATAVFGEIKRLYPRLAHHTFYIFCGKGNNGGDGLVLARLLDQQQAQVNVYLVDATDYSTANLANQKRLPAHLVQKISPENQVHIPTGTIVLDCLFGYGLKHPLAGQWHSLITGINRCSGPIYAIDMPSGLLSDGPTADDAPVIQADMVYTFQSPKLGLLMPDNSMWANAFRVLDIGLSRSALEQADTNFHYVDLALLGTFYRKRNKFDHKGTFGHSLIIGGSRGKMGAVQLALKAALRSGCGLASAYIPSCGYTCIQTAVPEAMVISDPEEEMITQFPDIRTFQSIGVGIGMGTAHDTIDAFKVFIMQGIDTALVLDADALNILAQDRDLWQFVPKGSILTPHPKELSRILGTWQNDFEKLRKAKTFAAEYQLYILIKGANSAIVTPDGTVYFNSTGNVGMATGGSGDILTGILTALLGQGYSSQETLLMGVYLHGRAADIAVQTVGVYSLLPSDIVSCLPAAFLELEKQS